jgi:hypothetical protein
VLTNSQLSYIMGVSLLGSIISGHMWMRKLTSSTGLSLIHDLLCSLRIF